MFKVGEQEYRKSGSIIIVGEQAIVQYSMQINKNLVQWSSEVDKKPDSAFKVGGQETRLCIQGRWTRNPITIQGRWTKTWTSIKGRWKKKPYPVFNVDGRKTQKQCTEDPTSEGSNILVWFGSLYVLPSPLMYCEVQLGTVGETFL